MKRHLIYLTISIIFILSSIIRFYYIINSSGCRHGCIPIIAFLLFIVGIVLLLIGTISFFKSKKDKF